MKRILALLIKSGLAAVFSLLVGIFMFYQFLQHAMLESAWIPAPWRPMVLIVTAVGASAIFSFLHIYRYHVERATSLASESRQGSWSWLLRPSLSAAMTWFGLAVVALVIYVGLVSVCFIGNQHDLYVPIVFPTSLEQAIEARDGLVVVANSDRAWLQDQLDHVYTKSMGMTSAILLLVYVWFIIALTASFTLSFSVVEGVLEHVGRSWLA